MSNVYALEPQPNAKVVLHTTLGDIEIEMWAKETPKATRNFIQLCLEGYYDNTIFHRVVPNFIVQGGDPTGTGQGGESIYDDEFPDEFHSRLRFNRRGLVGMANTGQNDNGSQFFITLDRAEDLTRKHTLFGRVVGDTIFNVVKMGELQVDSNDRPVYPPRIKSTEVLLNPFDDIIPRMSERERRRAMELEAELREKAKPKKKETKKLNLLSFGEEAAEMEPSKEAASFGKMKSSYDTEENSKASSSALPTKEQLLEKTASTHTYKQQSSEKSREGRSEDRKSRKESSKDEPRELTTKEKVAQLKNEIKNLSRHRDDEAERAAAEREKQKNKSIVEMERQRYLENGKAKTGGLRARKQTTKKDDTLRKLLAFQRKLSSVEPQKALEKKHLPPCKLHAVPDCESCYDLSQLKDVETDEGWMGHLLKFEKDLKGKDLMQRRDNLDDYVVIDPREREAAALQDEYTRKRSQKSSSKSESSSRKRDQEPSSHSYYDDDRKRSRTSHGSSR